MPQIKEILSSKGTEVVAISPDATVFEAAVLMNKHKIGAVVVVENGRLVGIFTERDVLRRVVGEQRDPAAVKIRNVMTDDVACGSLDTSIEEAKAVMKNRRIRHLPVVDEEMRLQGMISIGDLNAYRVDSQEVTIRFLHEYIYGYTYSDPVPPAPQG